MSEFTVVVTDHDVESLAIDEEVLGDVATVRDLSDAPQAEFDAAVAEADGVLNLRRTLSDELVSRIDECRIIARYGIGVDNVALEAAADRGVYVTNVPDYCVEEVATGGWDRNAVSPLRRLSTRTVGLVGTLLLVVVGSHLANRAFELGLRGSPSSRGIPRNPGLPTLEGRSGSAPMS